MTNIIGKVQSLGFGRSVAEKMNQFILNLDGLGVQGVDKLIKKLKKAPDIATFRDYWLEGFYARIFAVNGFSVMLEPCGSKGPDVGIHIDNHAIYVEVKHLRLVNDQSKSHEKAVAGVIRAKLKQTLDNEINIVIIHSGRITFSTSVFYRGMYLCKRLCLPDRLSANKFQNLSGVIINMPFFGSGTQGPIYWRFLQTSREKTPSEVKKKLREILEAQNVLEHQKILNMISKNLS